MYRKVTSTQFRELLTDFASQVDEGFYERLSYSTWRKLTKFPCDEYIYIALMDRSKIKIFSDQELDNDYYIQFTIFTDSDRQRFVDNSFGQYLYHWYFDEVIPTCLAEEDMIKEEKKVIRKENDKKENEPMNKMFNVEFGPCGNSIHMSVYGVAIKNSDGNWVSYDKEAGDIMNVDILNFDASKFMYKMPVAIKDVKPGDVVIHMGQPVFVTKNEDTISVIDIYAGEKKNILPTKNMFGFNFLTKIVSLFDMSNLGTPSADSPFGNMLPLMLMGNGTDKMDPMAMAMMMGGGQLDLSNPMMMYLMMKDGGTADSMLPFLMMNMNQSKKN